MIVDVSIAMAWCFEDEANADTERILRRVAEEGALVPSLWWQEVANTLLVAWRHGRIGRTTASRAARLLQHLPLTTAEPHHGVAELVDLATDHQLNAYDATYLSLAMTGSVPLATLDTDLRRAAEACGVEVLPIAA